MSKGDQTRQRIIAEAASLFNRRGFEGGSLLDVMEATGLEKGGIYRHFSSKEELAAAAFDYAWNQASAARRQEVDSIENNADKLLRMIRNFVERRAPGSRRMSVAEHLSRRRRRQPGAARPRAQSLERMAGQAGQGD